MSKISVSFHRNISALSTKQEGNGIAKIADALGDGLIFETGWVIATDTDAEPATGTDAEPATDPEKPGDAQTGDDVATGTDAEEGNDTDAPDHTATDTDAEEDLFHVAYRVNVMDLSSLPDDEVASDEERTTWLTDILTTEITFNDAILGEKLVTIVSISNILSHETQNIMFFVEITICICTAETLLRLRHMVMICLTMSEFPI